MIFFRALNDLQPRHYHAMKLINKKHFGREAGPDSMKKFLEKFSSFYSDALYASKVDIFAKTASEVIQSPVYQYIYTHTGSLSMAEVAHLSFWQTLFKVSCHKSQLDIENRAAESSRVATS